MSQTTGNMIYFYHLMLYFYHKNKCTMFMVYGKGIHFKKIHVTGLLHLKLVISTLKIKNVEVDISDIETITNWKYRSKIILIMQLIIKWKINYFLKYNGVKTIQNLMNLLNDRMKLFFANGVKQKVSKKGEPWLEIVDKKMRDNLHIVLRTCQFRITSLWRGSVVTWMMYLLPLTRWNKLVRKTDYVACLDRDEAHTMFDMAHTSKAWLVSWEFSRGSYVWRWLNANLITG